jgi:nucleoside-diphosphate-sugar epimerase
MAVFITGGHGHIGYWVAHFLAEAGEQVLLYDTNPHAPDTFDPSMGQITYIKGDVLDFPRLVDIFREYKGQIDGILHTVGIMGEIVPTNPHYNVHLNIAGTHNMLEIARLFEIPKVVYTSTGAVYKPVPGIVAEEAELGPSDLYTATKVSGEYLGQQYARTFGFEFRICRVYFLYGPGKLPSDFVRLYQLAFGALQGLPDLRMDKGAIQKLDFTYIEDAARGTAMLYQAKKLEHDIYNIATGEPNSIGHVAKLAQQHTRIPGSKVELGLGTLMARAEALDISRAREELGYQPQFSLEEGIQKYADWIANVCLSA